MLLPESQKVKYKPPAFKDIKIINKTVKETHTKY